MSNRFPNSTATASPRSLPLCLRHTYLDDCVDDALNLLSFLRDVTLAQQGGDPLSDSALRGQEIVFNLLQDKLEIITGRYRFPLSGDADSPVLCEREEE